MTEILYLLPKPDSPLALAAVDLPVNSPHVQELPLHQTLVFTPSRLFYRCLCVSVPPAGVEEQAQPWTFTIGSHGDADIVLPPPQTSTEHYNLSFGLAHMTVDNEDAPGLFVCCSSDTTSSSRPHVYDPMNMTEVRDAREDPITTSPRYLEEPCELSVGSYQFYVFQSNWLALRFSLYGLSEPLPANTPEQDWRPLGTNLGEGAYGTVRFVRGMKTGVLRARKAVRIGLVSTMLGVEEEVRIMGELRDHVSAGTSHTPLALD